MKKRTCRSCGILLPTDRIMLCEACSAAGLGASLPRRGKIDAQELLEIVRDRSDRYANPLAGLTLDEVAALARLYKSPYTTYGRFRGYVEATRHLPPEEYRR